MRRATTVLLTGLLTTGGLATLAPSASASPTAPGPITPRALTITVTDLGPEHRTCAIDADLYVPAGVNPGHRAPAVLTTNGFGGTKADQADFAQSFGEHGYVTLAYTGLGFVDGDTCPITLDDREHDGEAASQLLRFLGGDPRIPAVDRKTRTPVHVDQVIRDDGVSGRRYDPRAGMIGGSYGGQVQFAAAAVERAHGTDRLDAIVPFITWNDLSYSLDPDDELPPRADGSVSGDGPGAFKYQWSLFFTAIGVENGAQDLRSLLTPQGFRSFAAQVAGRQDCGNFEVQVCTALAEVGAQGYPGPASIQYLRSNSVAGYMADVRVPTLLGQGQADTLFDLQESLATYQRLRAQGTPVALQWQSWGHSSSTPAPGELDERHLENSYQGQRVLGWFDHWLGHRGSTPALGFSYFRDWVYATTGRRTAADAAAAYASGPLPGTRTTTYHLSGADAGGATVPDARGRGISTGGGSLVTDASLVTPGTSSFTDAGPFGPNYSETSAVESSLSPEPPPTDPPGTSVRFLTDALTAPLDVVGSPELTVQLDAPSAALSQRTGPAGQLVVYAKVYDVGPDGAVELPHRLVSPARVSDVTRPVTVELPAIVHRFAAGHRLAVVLAGGDLAYRGADGTHPVALSTGPGRVQQLTVPLAG